ncbi:MAG: hypothetical protein WC346_04385 [Methanogenium sp.]|jgi:rRNA maturation endonuclease Nob1
MKNNKKEKVKKCFICGRVLRIYNKSGFCSNCGNISLKEILKNPSVLNRVFNKLEEKRG